MIVRANPEDLDKEIVKMLEDWANVDVRRAANEAIKETAQTAAKMMKKGGPYKNRTGQYAKNWAAKLRKGKYTKGIATEEYSIHNKKHYRIAHLLEKGHISRKKGERVKAYEHIEPIRDLAEQLVISNIEKRVREIS